MTGMSKQERLNEVLSTLRSSMPDVYGALVATADGLPISQSMREGTDANRVAAMAATAIGLGKRINDTIGSGELTELSVSGKASDVFIYTAGNRGILAVVTPANINLGLLHMEARDAARSISSIL